MTRGGGRAPDGDWTCQLLHGLQLGWALQAASCYAKVEEQGEDGFSIPADPLPTWEPSGVPWIVQMPLALSLSFYSAFLMGPHLPYSPSFPGVDQTGWSGGGFPGVDQTGMI